MSILGELSEEEVEFVKLVSDGNASAVRKQLDDKTVRVDCLDEHGMTPLMTAAYKGDVTICRILLKHGANVNTNYHAQGYTTIMFAALSGNLETTQLMLEAGARTTATNNVGRTATQMAAFVGQHQCVSLINNFFGKDDLEIYTVPRGHATEAMLPTELCDPLYKIILNSNLHPVKISYLLQENIAIMNNSTKVCKLMDLLCKKQMTARVETNEILAIKFHYISTVIKEAAKSLEIKQDNLEAWIKRMVRGRAEDGFCEDQERLIRSMLKDFPYSSSGLLQQCVRTIATVKVGDDPTALVTLGQCINGQRMARDEDLPCITCGDYGAPKKCSACKMVNYCNQGCQKNNWSSHKKMCKELYCMYLATKKRDEEEAAEAARKKEDEEKKKLEELSGGDVQAIEGAEASNGTLENGEEKGMNETSEARTETEDTSPIQLEDITTGIDDVTMES